MELEELYSRYFSDVYRYIRRLSGSEQLAEEITSDTFFKAMRSIEAFRGDCDLRIWLCQIAKNCYYSHMQKARRFVGEAALAHMPDTGAAAGELLERQDDLRRIQKALHTLPQQYKEVFMWRVYAELSFAQIGQLFDKTDNWACVTHHRAKAMLKSRLDETDNEA